MVQRLKNSGNYKIYFFVTPQELQGILEFMVKYEVSFHITNNDNTLHGIKEVISNYEDYYQRYTSLCEKDIKRCIIVYSMPFHVATSKSNGLFLLSEEKKFVYYRQWADTKLPALRFTFNKGIVVNMKDEKGEYYIYEDVRNTEPECYEVWTELVYQIKKITKPLRYTTHLIDKVEEVKTKVYISKQAAKDLGQSWIFRKFELEMLNYK